MGAIIGLILGVFVIVYDPFRMSRGIGSGPGDGLRYFCGIVLCCSLLVLLVTYEGKDRKSYTAIVKNTDGTETTYEVTSYDTKDNSMTLRLKDGTKVFVPITNITISEQTTETN